MKISVYHTPELTPTDKIPNCAIAIDVLRATSTIATVLYNGGEAVQVFSDMQKLMSDSENWSPQLRLRAGERGGAKVEGCDLGNSPLDCTPELVKGKRLFISTTNGTRALQCVESSPVVLAAALINRKSIVQYLLTHKPEEIWLVCSGWEGSFSLEDTVCAGAIATGVLTGLNTSIENILGNDELVGAIALYQQWQNDLLGLFHHANHGQRLLRLNCLDDLKYCSQTDILDVLPMQSQPGVLINQLIT